MLRRSGEPTTETRDVQRPRCGTAPGPRSAASGDSGRITGVAEVLDHLIRLAGADEEDAALDLAQLGLLDGVVVDSDRGVAAGRLRARRYHRSHCAVSMADCIAAEAARRRCGRHAGGWLEVEAMTAEQARNVGVLADSGRVAQGR